MNACKYLLLICAGSYCLAYQETKAAQQAYLKSSNSEAFDLFGSSVAISGDTIVVGAYWEDSAAAGVNGNQSDNSLLQSGAAYVFVRNGSNWIQQAYLKASNPSASVAFGSHVAVSDNTIVIGSDMAAYVFVRAGTNWTQQAYLGGGVRDVVASGNTLVLNEVRQLQVHVRNGTNWSHQATLQALGPSGFRNIASVAIDNNTLVAGSVGDAYIFVRSGTNWSQQARLAPLVPYFFGNSVAVSGDTVVVGDYNEASNATGVNGNPYDDTAPDSGAAYIFVRSGTTWRQQAYLKASNTSQWGGDLNSGDYFGWQVAISDNTVVVGANWEDSLATGINGNQTDNRAYNAGAAYVFARLGTNWTQQAYLKASNTSPNDEFGRGVGISGDTIVVSAYAENSSATGVNGNDRACCADGSGAAFVFGCLGIPARLTIRRDGSAGYFVGIQGGLGCSYLLERATSIQGTWQPVATLPGSVSGLNEFHDSPAPPGQAFYRAVSQ